MTAECETVVQAVPKQTCVKYLCKPLDKFHKVRYNIATIKTYDKMKIYQSQQIPLSGRPATPPQPKLQAEMPSEI